MGLLIDALRGHVCDAEAAIVTLEREVMEATAAGRRTDLLRAEIRAISETRNFLLARLRRLDAAATQAFGSPKTGPASALQKSL